MQGYCQSAQRTQSTALFTCSQRADLEQQVTRCREALAPKAHRAASFWFPFPPAPRRVDQGEEGREQPALLQLRHPHQLQNQKRGHEPQDVATGPRPCRTRGTRGANSTTPVGIKEPSEPKQNTKGVQQVTHPGNRCLCSSGTHWQKGQR